MRRLARYVAKEVAMRALGCRPVVGLKLRSIASDDVLTILNLHRVSTDARSAYGALHPRLFDELLGWLKTRFCITTFARLGESDCRSKPAAILSFDDGYRDFAEIAAPILRKHGLVANQNIIPSCLEAGRPPLNVLVQDFIGSAPASLLREVALPGLPNGADPSDRVGSGLRASAGMKYRPIAEQKALVGGLQQQFARFDGFRPTPMLTLEDLRQLASEHEIGAHSFEHATMSVETDEYVANDARRCQSWFEANLGKRACIYAFPNGAFRSGQEQFVLHAGFDLVLLVGEQFSRRGALVHPRFTFHAGSGAEARFRAVGGFARTRHYHSQIDNSHAA